MRHLSLFIGLLLVTVIAQSQLLKNIGRGIKRDAEYKIERKVLDKANQAMDSLTKAPKKASKKKTSDNNEPAKTEQKQMGPTKTSVVQDAENEPTADEGYITLQLSTPITTKGLSVNLTGESIRYDKWKTVTIDIEGEIDESFTVPLSDSGKYNVKYDLLKDGEYEITATSSDGKSKVSEKLIVLDFSEPKEETAELKNVVKEAFDNLKEQEEAVKQFLSNKHKTELAQKVNETKERVDALDKLCESLITAKKQMAGLYKSGKLPPRNMREHLTQLNVMVVQMKTDMKQVMDAAKHKPSDLTICDYIVMLNEACAAFSTISNFATKSIAAILTNITLDKVVPKTVEVMNKGRINSDVEWGAKETSKIYATSKVDAEGLVSKMGKFGFAGDVVQYATDVLLKVHCGIFKGTVTHKYNLVFRNNKNVPWWSYGVESEAAITLRYPKSNNEGKIKMKGNIEGNATRFRFFADPELNTDYREYSEGKVPVTILKSYTPFTLPGSMALHDELGFGALARAVGTPAYFNIAVDAEYNTETGKIKLFINDALVDFTIAIANRQFFVQWVAGLPKLRMMEFPINKARLTINASLKEENEFKVTGGPKGEISFGANVKRKIGTASTPTEHSLEIYIAAKKEN